jgi:hypothetical protein
VTRLEPRGITYRNTCLRTTRLFGGRIISDGTAFSGVGSALHTAAH